MNNRKSTDKKVYRQTVDDCQLHSEIQLILARKAAFIISIV